MDDLQTWIAQAKEHWRQFRPDLYREAKAEGKLYSLLAEAARLTRREMDSLMANGLSEQGPGKWCAKNICSCRRTRQRTSETWKPRKPPIFMSCHKCGNQRCGHF